MRNSTLTIRLCSEDIIILYDGVCASTCTLASEFLRLKGGVKSVAFGGRPSAGPIQGVGGVKGSQVLNFANIYGFAQDALRYAETDAQKAALQRYSPLPLQRSSAAAVNTRDQILPGNVNDGLPAQFVQEPTECRLYWTAPMIFDATAAWKAAADAAFNGAKCAAGGIERPAKREAQPAPFRGAGQISPLPATAEARDQTRAVGSQKSKLFKAFYEQKAIP